MKLIMPMAGWGTRMRPHTWSRPKPLFNIAGRPLIELIIELFKGLPIEEYVFIVGPMADQIKTYVQETMHLRAVFVEQPEMLGQAHAYWLARKYLTGPILTFFPDTLFDKTDFSVLEDPALDGVIFTKTEEDPRPFGSAISDANGRVVRLIEKPPTKEHKHVLMGIYYFRDGAWFARACGELIQKGRKTRGEYFQSDAVTLMLEQGAYMRTSDVGVWLDAGMPHTTLETHRYLLNHGYDNSEEARRPGVAIIPPVYVHPEALIERSVIGPYVSLGKGATVRNSVLRNVIADEKAVLEAVVLEESLVGRWVQIKDHSRQLNVGDSSSVNPYCESSADPQTEGHR